MAKITSATPSKNAASKVSKPVGEVKIRRPENCFMLFKKAFARENGKTIRSQQDLCKAASQAWHAMDEEEQAPWRELQERVKAEHARKYPGYVYKPKPKAPKHAVKRDATFTLPPAPRLTPPLVPDSGHGASPMAQLIGMGVPTAQPQVSIGLDATRAGYNTYSDCFVEPRFQPQNAFDFSPSQVMGTLGAPGQYGALDVGLDWNGVSYPAMPMDPSLFNSFYGPSAPGMNPVVNGSTAPFDFGPQFIGASSAGTSDNQSTFTYL